MTELEDTGGHRNTAMVVTSYGRPGLQEFGGPGWDVTPGSGPARDNLLLDYWRLLTRRRVTIVLLALTGAALGFLTTVAKLPVYRARTSLEIENINSDFMNRRSVTATGDTDDSSAESYVQTQIKLLQGDTLRTRTVARLKASNSVPELKRGDLLSDWEQKAHLPAGAPLTSREALKFTAERVTIKPLGLTRLVEVTCDSWDAKFSAEFCNALIREFSLQDQEVRWNDAQRTSEWLTRQVADVRDSLAKAESKLELTTDNDGLLLADGGATVAQERLRELQSELTKAQADRVAKQSVFDISQSAPSESLPSVLDSEPLRDQDAKLAELRRQVAALVPPLTEENPKVQHLRAQIAQVERTRSAVEGNVLDRLKSEYQAAKHREALLASSYAAQEKLVSQQLSKQNQVSLLRHEVESGQQLYQTLLQRVKEAGFASAMQASTIRVVDAAKPPEIPIAPRRGMATVIGFLLGCLAGIGTAFTTERTQTALRAPGDVPHYLQLRELGVIPSSGRELGGSSFFRPRLLSRPVRSSPEENNGNLIRKAVLDGRRSLLAEAYRNTTYSVLRAGKEARRGRTYVITSPSSGDGKTTVTCNLGIALAQAKRRVLLVDGDLRRPRLHKAAGIENSFGLRNLLRGEPDGSGSVEQFCRQTEVSGLYVLTAGTGHEEPAIMLHAPTFPELLRSVAREFDYVLVDTPPVLHMADARIMAGLTDGVILVFRARSTVRETAKSARDLFLNDGVEVVGTILNDFNPAKEGRNRYYSSYYDYHSDNEKSETAASA